MTNPCRGSRKDPSVFHLTEETSMRKPHVTTKRVLGTVLALGLVAAGSLAVASTSEAVAVPAMTISPASGSTVGGDTITIKGKGLADDSGAAVAISAIYTTAACADGTPSSAAGYQNLTTGLTVTSATKAVLVIPTLSGVTAGSGYLCLFDKAVGAAGSVVGSAKYAVGVAPAITTVNGVADATTTVINASTFGGTALTLVGTDFTKKSVISVGGTAAPTKYVSATKVTATVPAGTAGTGKAIKVTTEFGSDTSAGNTVTYKGVIKVSPAVGAPSTATGVELTGTGFNSLTFTSGVATDNGVEITFVPGGTTLAAASTIPTTMCTNVVVQSDTLLSCKTPSSLSGAYSLQIVKRGTTAGSDQAKVATGGLITAISRSSTYTAAAF